MLIIVLIFLIVLPRNPADSSYSLVSLEFFMISAATSFALCLISSCVKISLCVVDILSFKVYSSIFLASTLFSMSFTAHISSFIV